MAHPRFITKSLKYFTIIANPYLTKPKHLRHFIEFAGLTNLPTGPELVKIPPNL